MARWFLVRGGAEDGPITTTQLKDMAATGQLGPQQLVRRDDMKEPVAARRVKGLFPAEAGIQARPAASPVQPPVATLVQPQQVTSVTAKPPQAVPVQLTATTPTPTPAVALWNPSAVRWWSLLFTWVFGSILLAKNWRALGRPWRARRAMVWCWATIPYVLIARLSPDTAPITALMRGISTVILVGWIYLEALPQIRFVKKHFGDNYGRKPWLRPLGIGAASFVPLVLGAMLLFAGVADDEHITKVKNGSLSSHPGTPVGKALDHFLGHPQWTEGETKSGQQVVNVTGDVMFQGQRAKVLLQFMVNPEAGTFELYALELNGVGQNRLVQAAFMDKVFEEYRH
jgi:hypothetical protein